MDLSTIEVMELPAHVPGLACDFIGDSPATTRVRALARSVASHATTVCLFGETGSGKEMLARYIHQHSPRSTGRFIPVDCSSFAETLFESQFFGHMKGAFTGATRDTLGFARAADGGTLFLDEVGELTLNLQAKLLRVIQERCVVPVGGTEPIPIDVRLICATNRDLRTMVDQNTFRQDLFFRLHVVALEMPALRERREDILPLAEFFLARQAGLSNEPAKTLSAHAAESLVQYSWPGNIRELFNALEHACVMSPGEQIELADLPVPLNNFGFLGQGRPSIGNLNLAQVERQTIMEALKRSRSNRTAACRLLGVNLRYLNRRITSLKIPLR